MVRHEEAGLESEPVAAARTASGELHDGTGGHEEERRDEGQAQETIGEADEQVNPEDEG